MINLTYVLFAIISVLIIIIFFICSSSSKFGSDSISIAPTISNDSVLIFYAPWCGYCKDKMDEFKRAAAEGNGKIILIDDGASAKNKYNFGLSINPLTPTQ